MSFLDLVKAGFKQAAGAAQNLAKSQALVNRLLLLPAEQMLNELQSALAAMTDGECNMFELTVAGRIGGQKTRIKELEEGSGTTATAPALAEARMYLQALEQISEFTSALRNGQVPDVAAYATETPASAPVSPSSALVPMNRMTALPVLSQEQSALGASPIYLDAEPVSPRQRTGPCQQCRHFRGVRQPSQLLANTVGEVGRSKPEVSNVLMEISRDEMQQKTAEANRLVHLMGLGHDEWGFRPVMSEFCGLYESESVYPICEMKNRGQQCTDFDPNPEAVRSCSTCTHRVLSWGRDRDAELQSAAYMGHLNAIKYGQSGSIEASFYNGYRAAVGPEMAMEIQSVYTSKGQFTDEHKNGPAYLDHCRKYSDSRRGQFVACVLQNPHDTCPGWKRGEPQSSSQTTEKKKAAESKSGNAGKVAGRVILGAGALVGGLAVLNEILKAQTPSDTDAPQADQSPETTAATTTAKTPHPHAARPSADAAALVIPASVERVVPSNRDETSAAEFTAPLFLTRGENVILSCPACRATMCKSFSSLGRPTKCLQCERRIHVLAGRIDVHDEEVFNRLVASCPAPLLVEFFHPDVPACHQVSQLMDTMAASMPTIQGDGSGASMGVFCVRANVKAMPSLLKQRGGQSKLPAVALLHRAAYVQVLSGPETENVGSWQDLVGTALEL